MLKRKIILRAFIVFCLIATSVSIYGSLNDEEVSVDFLDNIDSEYITKVEKEEYVADLLVKNTYIDKDFANKCDNKLDKYFEYVHNNDFLDNYYVTTVTNVPLYNLSDSSDYVVGNILTDENEILDIVFAENNDDGKLLGDEVYDSDTGLVYIRKCDLYKIIDSELYIDYVQAQTLRGISEGNKTNVNVCVNDNYSMIIDESVLDPEISIPIKDVTSGNVDIYINDYDVPLSEDNYSVEDGNLVIKTSPANISKVEIDTNSTTLDKITSSIEKFIGAEKVYALSTYDSAITSEFGKIHGELCVGDYVRFSATGTNVWDAKGINYVQTVAGSAPNHTSFYNSIIRKNADDVNEYVTGTYNGGYQNVYKSTYNACYGINMNSSKIIDYNNETLKKWIENIDDEIQMGCIEVSTAAFRDMAYNDTLDYTAIVCAVGDNYVAISFCSTQKTSRGQSNQVMCGTYAVSYEEYPPSEAYFVDTVWSEYGEKKTFLSDDIKDMTEKKIKPPTHNKSNFIGYFLENGQQVTDNSGNVLDKSIPGVIKDGVFVNIEPIKLYAEFDDS